MSRDRPLLVFDGSCRFCRGSVVAMRRATGERVAYAPSRDVAAGLPGIPAERFEREVVLVEEDGRVTGGAQAIFRALARAPGRGAGVLAYDHLPGFAPVAEAVYRAVASRRVLAAHIARAYWGPDLEPPTYHLARLWFVKLLALTYLVAFASLGVQVRGLLGAEGILPAASRLAFLRQRLGGPTPAVPTLFWISASDGALQGACLLGALLAILLLLRGFLQAPVLLALWALYLSLVVVGGDFLHFQWDVLLLEAGLLAVLLAPWRLVASVATEPPPPLLPRLLLWLLVVKLMLGSGLVKLLSEDPMWWDLTALTVHYQTQPLPNLPAWYVHQLPASWHRLSCALMFAVELGAPLCVVAPRRLRTAAALVMMGLMAVVALTGNYAFFNMLTVAILVTLLDDRTLAAVSRARVVGILWSRPPGDPPSPVARAAIAAVSVALGLLSAGAFLGRLGRPVAALERARDVVAPLRSVNAYGLFADMTERRPEIVLEGSDDGITFRPYELRYKPGRLDGVPRQVAPHQPRLDWQLWFAALDPEADRLPWLRNLQVRLLQGSAPVLALLAEEPFPERPPRYLRLMRYEYAFTSLEERRSSGRYWRRRLLGQVGPVASLATGDGGS